jgi:hypothetical protein
MFVIGARRIVAAGVVVVVGAVPAACVFAPIDYSGVFDDTTGMCASTLGCVVETECRTVTCPGATCQTTNAPPGKRLAQIAHDCTRRQCDGAGNVILVAEPGDAPEDDGNPCTIEDCDDATPPNAPAGTGCINGVCDGLGHCATCDDGIRNGNETDVDCGGPECPHCDGEVCSGDPSGCQSGHCVDGVCCTTACDKKCDACAVSFTGVPSGMCAPVILGKQHGDSCMQLGGCGVANLCACEDSVKNQDEAGVDCGGICAAGCNAGVPCKENLDCKSGSCKNDACL